jgi:hypothetical protein
MRHARDDYNRIQDQEGLIPDDEPVFLLRGQDICAPAAVEAWADLAETLRAAPEIVRAARMQAKRMRKWQEGYFKVPDMPEAAARTRSTEQEG